jgi:endonuclease-3
VPARSRPRATPTHARRILDTLEREHPEARCALSHRNPFELAVATILSAQCTDERVNMVTPLLFARFPDARTLARAEASEVEQIIRSTGFFRSKTRSLLGLARTLVERHEAQLPRDMASLVKLPGIGRKTANVILGHAFGVNEGIAVDTHVLRVTNRLGLVSSDDPSAVESRLMELVPRERWARTADLIIFHGRKVCDARRPGCGRCTLFALCGWDGRLAWASVAPPGAGRLRREPGRGGPAPRRRLTARVARSKK